MAFKGVGVRISMDGDSRMAKEYCYYDNVIDETSPGFIKSIEEREPEFSQCSAMPLGH
mgnify:CR=1 FL=1